jgi:hypothetical protein
MWRRKLTARQRTRIGTMKPKLPCLIFTLDELVFLKKALVPLEEVMLAQKAPLPNLEFALATVTQVQAKIQCMIQRGIWGEEVEMDANEVLILQTAVWMFEATLEIVGPCPEKEQLQQLCRALDAILATPAKHCCSSIHLT